jgi:hypothetical protein
MKHQNRKVLDTGTSAARDDAEADSDHFNAKKTE